MKTPTAKALNSISKENVICFNTYKELRQNDFFKKIPKRFVYSDLANLILPALVEYALLQFVGMFDQIQVGVLGEHALSALGVASQIRFVLVTIFQAIGIGVTALVARSVGLGRKEDFFPILLNGLKLCTLFGIPVIVLSLVCLNPILKLFNPPSVQAWDYVYDYLFITILFSLPYFQTIIITAALRGFGDTKTPLIYNVLANLINIFLNWILITGKFGFERLEVKGAAIATVISRLIAFVVAVFVCVKLWKSENEKKIRKDSKFSKGILKIGFPTMIEQLIARIGMSMFTVIATTLGTTLYAAHSACLSIQQLTTISGMAFSVASTTLAGQSLGAGRKDMAVIYTVECVKLCLIPACILSAVYAFLGADIIKIYIDDYDVIQAGVPLLRMVALTQPLIAFQYVFAGAFKGAGDTKTTAVIYIIASFVLRPLFAYIGVFVLNLSMIGVWLGLVIDQSICALLLIFRFRSFKWLNKLDFVK